MRYEFELHFLSVREVHPTARCIKKGAIEGHTDQLTVHWTGDWTKLGHLLCVWKRHRNCRVSQMAVHSILHSLVFTCA